MRPTPRSGLRTAGVLSAVLLSGCILLIDDDPDKLGATCHVARETSPCGKCITTRCQPKLNTCCGDPSCSGTLGALDACITDFTGAACGTYAQTPSSTRTSEDALRACVSECADTCRTTTGSSITSCTAFAYLESTCSCSGSGNFNDTACSSESVGTGVCCADFGWPDTGLSCSCNSYRCKQTADGCTCGTSTSGPMTSCAGAYCCASYGTCSCGSKPCSSSATRVNSCGPSTQECSGKKSVSSCSQTTGSRTQPVTDAGKKD